MNLDIAYGQKKIELDLPAENLLAVLRPREISLDLTGEAEVRRALAAPINAGKIGEIVNPGEKTVIITSDITRPLPSGKLLAPLLEELYAAGCKPDDLLIVFALGSHRRHTEQEMRYLVGDRVYDTVKCIDLDTSDCLPAGKTKYGTKVDVFRPVLEADRRICLGNIEYHYFAGYSGGVKAVMPGVCTHEAIQQNHSQMVQPSARAGAIEDNPVRQDIDDVLSIVSVDFILNVVLDEKKEIIKAVAGHPLDAHRAGCRFLDRIYKCQLERQADIVIVSSGGYPKDINVYQAQKALDNARHAVRDGGIIIWLAACTEGLGEKCFERWMTSYSPSFMLEEIARNFQLGGHKAAAIAMVLQKSRIFLVSDLEPDFVRSIHLEPEKDVDSALNKALEILGSDASIIVMPFGGSTLPVII